VSNNIVIKPTWERYSPAGRDIVIDIDPGMAFGTGQHASTTMCIMVLEDILLKNSERGEYDILDVGTGTGILAICAAKLGAHTVTGIDIDPKAVEIAGKNIVINGVKDRVEIINRDIALCSGSFDLIVANLISGGTYKTSLTSYISDKARRIYHSVWNHKAGRERRGEDILQRGNCAV